MRRDGGGNPQKIVTDGHTSKPRVPSMERTAHAKELFAPLGPTYDRSATVLSFGQDPRWRRFLVSRVRGRARRHRARRRHGHRRGRPRAPAPEGLHRRRRRPEPGDARGGRPPPPRRAVRLVEASAEALPFEDGQFDALTFTYLLRYVDDPAATLRELARVVRPGGTIAGLEFGLPRGVVAAARGSSGCGSACRSPAFVIGQGWREAGSFLGGSIRDYDRRWPLDRLVAAWRDAGIDDVQGRRLSLGGGNVTWGRKRA